jgi:56kDa selenium binding protein (SBP56)
VARSVTLYRPGHGQRHPDDLELRPSHDPTKTYGFAGVVVSLKDLSSSIWMWYRAEGGKGKNGQWAVHKVIEIPAEPADPANLPPRLQGFKAVPPMVTDINLSVDDRFLYASCWGASGMRRRFVGLLLLPRCAVTCWDVGPTAFWLMLLLGAYHGINPGMGGFSRWHWGCKRRAGARWLERSCPLRSATRWPSAAWCWPQRLSAGRCRQPPLGIQSPQFLPVAGFTVWCATAIHGGSVCRWASATSPSGHFSWLRPRRGPHGVGGAAGQ